MNELLAITGSVCLALALIEAWMLVEINIKPDGALSKIIIAPQDLLKSHLDYLLMALFLYVFYLLFAHFQIKPAIFLIVSMCVGSVGNAGLFLIRAAKPEYKSAPSMPFQLMMVVSCLLTTIGYAGGAWLITVAATGYIQ